MQCKSLYNFQLQLLVNGEEFITNIYHVIASDFDEANFKLIKHFERKSNVKLIEVHFLSIDNAWV